MIKDYNGFIDLFSQVIAKMNHDDIISQLEYKASLLSLLAHCLQESHYDPTSYHHENNDIFSRILLSVLIIVKIYLYSIYRIILVIQLSIFH